MKKSKPFLTPLLVLALSTNAIAQNATATSESSNTVPLKVIDKPLTIEIIQPVVATRGEVYIHREKTLTVKGRIVNKIRSKIVSLSVNKLLTDPDSLGYFSQEIRLPHLESEIVVKVLDNASHSAEASIKVYYPTSRESVVANKRQATDYALLIATNDYENWNKLTNPVFDAKTLAQELTTRYDFKVETVTSPTLNGLISAIRKLNTIKFNDDDQVFIFIAGHGVFDGDVKEGYIVPKDAKAKNDDPNKISYLDHSRLKTIINNIPCKHILLVLDVCFGGTFDQSIAQRGSTDDNILQVDDFVSRKLRYKTRIFLTSGGNEYVPDGRPGFHSPFTRQFLEALRSEGGDDHVLTFGELFSFVDRVTPEPRKGGFGDNDPGSDFLFIVK